MSNAAQLKAAILSVVERGHDIVVDMSGCRYIDSSGLGALVAARRRHASLMRFVVPRIGSIYRVFEITGLSKQFTVFETLGAAIATIPLPPATRLPSD